MAKKKTKTKSAAKTRKTARAKRRAPVKARAVKSRRTPKAKAKAKAAPRRRSRTKAAARGSSPSTTSITTLPDIEVETTGGGKINLASLKGRNVVLYFYPKDDTPGCTREGCDIRDRYDEFRRLDTVVYGVSRDGLASHERFKSKYGFPFELIADPDEKLCRAFGVIRKKTLYGRTYMGVERSTFVFDRSGALRREFRGVKVPGHVDEVLEAVRSL